MSKIERFATFLHGALVSRTLNLYNYSTRDFGLSTSFPIYWGLFIFTISPCIGGDFSLSRVFSCKLPPMLRSLSVHNFPHGLGTFVFYEFSHVLETLFCHDFPHVLGELSSYDFPHILETSLFTNFPLYWRRCFSISLAPATGTLRVLTIFSLYWRL